ncbi:MULTISPECIES: hypothetical protein [Serratia]|uniref:hypothetical protein n=1 Tax=Serratia TaxID=613 RepID=UPI000744E9A2|nr:hypothetical protein [Serratia marcescens]MBS6086131.1 hypothetical protein [Serratia marcescens]RJY04349.1 hypothetical protein D3I93_11540 [Serratia marcescens]RLO42552.1 hypothetical protein CLM67_21345 [Serratia marcescens]RLO56155.1 hypothetical protein CLM66_00965 [Serratia marcescens]CAI1591165.1 Uncharacterised protein [Serratia marcescens]
MIQAKPFILLAAVFLAGWFTAGLYSDSQQLIIERAATAGAEKSRRYTEQMAGESARLLESKLAELSANETHTERVIRTEVVKPIFSNVCATAEYVRLFNAATDRAERALSGQFVGPLPGNAAEAKR